MILEAEGCERDDTRDDTWENWRNSERENENYIIVSEELLPFVFIKFMAHINSLKPNPGSTKRRIRLARGLGSGKGGTSGRGNKGQNARSGAKRYPTFEWGQTPLFRRIPKKRGFTAYKQLQYLPVNLSSLAKLAQEGITEIDASILLEKKIIRKKDAKIKILSSGTLDTALTVTADAFSVWAKEKIEKAGGTVLQK